MSIHSDAPPGFVAKGNPEDAGRFLPAGLYRWKGPNKGNAAAEPPIGALGSVDDLDRSTSPQIAILFMLLAPMTFVRASVAITRRTYGSWFERGGHLTRRRRYLTYVFPAHARI